MKIPIVLGAAAMICGLFLLATPSSAHHSFAAEFDGKNCKDFTGTLRKLDWQSPHPYFFMDIKDAGGKVENWSFQAYSPVTLRRNGTDRQVFLDNIGKEVWVRGCLARNGKANAAAAGTLKFSDGVLRQVGQLQD